MQRSSSPSWGKTTIRSNQGNLRILNDAAGFLRMQLGKTMKLRTVPQLHFNYDASIRRGVELSSLDRTGGCRRSQAQRRARRISVARVKRVRRDVSGIILLDKPRGSLPTLRCRRFAGCSC